MNSQITPYRKFFGWILFNILLPASPIIFGIIVLILQADDLKKVLESSEFFFLAFIVLTVTIYEYMHTQNKEKLVGARYVYQWLFFMEVLLPLSALFSLLLFAVIYLDSKQIIDLKLNNPDSVLIVALMMSIGIGFTCLFAQWILIVRSTQISTLNGTISTSQSSTP